LNKTIYQARFGSAVEPRTHALLGEIQRRSGHDLETELRPLLARFAKERNAGERFGDWCERVLLKEQVAAATN